MGDKKIAVYSLLLGLVFTLGVSIFGYSEDIQAGIANEVIRFHVRANSDEAFDQELKVLVKDRVLEQFKEGLSAANNIGDTRMFLTENLPEIREYAQSVVRGQGYSYGVTAEITNDYFPTKTYGDVKLPAGNYETLRIDIGGADGKNWWCVMYPPLCFVDVSVKEIPAKEKSKLKSILTDEEYELVTSEKRDIKLKFKIVELVQEMRLGNTLIAKK